jgi:hypothetical protein
MMILLSTGEYVIFCSRCSESARQDASTSERSESRRLAVEALVQQGWRETQARLVQSSGRSLGAGTWECPACVRNSGVLRTPDS